ncbi:MAG: PAS domain S-box protein, partial [Acidobacteriota bacterium]|nr:PAS domain S-box protein [Acidobacteriota bacterium]
MLSFSVLTLIVTTVVILTWEKTVRTPLFTWIERRLPGSENAVERMTVQQRVEHFVISLTVDVVVVTLLLRIVRRQQRRLRASEERYRTLFEHAGDGIGVVRVADRRLVEANNKFCEILGCPAQGAVGADIGDFLRPPPGADGGDVWALLDGASGERELVAQTPGGKQLPVSVSFNTLATDEERLLVLIIRDLSARRQLEAEKEEMQRRLYQSSRLAALGELSAGVAHEINNPLNGIINFAQLLKDEPVERSDFERQM